MNRCIAVELLLAPFAGLAAGGWICSTAKSSQHPIKEPFAGNPLSVQLFGGIQPPRRQRCQSGRCFQSPASAARPDICIAGF